MCARGAVDGEVDLARLTITVDGAPLDAIDPDAWQRRVAAIFQDFTRYELPARDNVAFGALALAGDHEALRQAAELLARETVGVGHLPDIDDAGAVGAALGRASATDVIAELGTHAELVSAGGAYAELYELQARAYR